MQADWKLGYGVWALLLSCHQKLALQIWSLLDDVYRIFWNFIFFVFKKIPTLWLKFDKDTSNTISVKKIRWQCCVVTYYNKNKERERERKKTYMKRWNPMSFHITFIFDARNGYKRSIICCIKYSCTRYLLIGKVMVNLHAQVAQ